MAVDELVIKWSMDSNNFNDGLTAMNRNMNLLKSGFNATATNLKSFGSATDQLKNKQEYLTNAMEIQKAKVDTLKKAYDNQVQATGENSKEAENLAIKLNNQIGYYNKLEAELKKTNTELELQTNKWNTLSKNLNGIGSSFSKVGDKLTDIGKSMSLKVTAPIVAAGTAATKTAIDWESAFAGVKKTVDGTTEEIANLEQGIREMAKELPSSAEDIAGVAEAAGQLGIQTDNILGFTRTIIDLGNSTNLAGEQGASSLAKFANITGMAQTEFDRLGSTIVALGNNSATTESDIVEMAMRLAGAGTQVGMTEAQIVSLSAALSSVGIEAEAGGSAFSKVMVNMQLAVETGNESLNDFAKVAGMTTSEFSKDFKEDAIGALISFIQGLSNAEEQGSSSIKVLDDMGITEVRLRDSLLRASSASDLFNETIALGSEAWEENTALANEANQRYETTASKMTIAKNKLADVGIQIGEILIPHVINLLDKISNLATWLGNLSPTTQKVILVIGGLVAAIGPLLVIGGAIASGIGSLLTLFGTISGAIAVVTTGVAAATPAIGALATVFTVLTGPVGIVIGVIAGLVAIGVVLWKNWDVIKEKASQLGEWLSSVWEGIKAKTSETWGAIKDGCKNAWEGIKNAVMSVVEKLSSAMSKAWEGIKTVILFTWEVIKSIFLSVWSVISGIIGTYTNIISSILNVAWQFITLGVTTAWGYISEFFKGIWEGIVEFFKPIIDSIVNTATTAWEFIKTITASAFTEVKETVLSAWQSILDFIVPIVTSISTFLSTTWEAINSKVSEVWEAVKTTISNTWNSISEKTSQVWNSITGFFTVIWANIKAQFSESTTNAKNTISNAWNNILDRTRSVWESIKGAIMSPINSAVDFVREQVNKITGFFDRMNIKIPNIKMPHFSIKGEFSLKPPSVPYLGVDWYHTGGIFTQPTILGGIGVGDAYKGTGANAEAVIPLDSMYKNVRSIVREEQISQPIYVVVNVANNMDNKAIGKAVTTEVKKEITRGTNNYRKGKGGLVFG